MKTGNIGVTTENIFPVIKRFLYSDHEIFLREIVSNACDATQKLRTLASKGDFRGELGDMSVRISFDKEAGTLTVSDRGVGMTAEEIDRYINQIAASGAQDFLAKYGEKAGGDNGEETEEGANAGDNSGANAIIGHFGLGFYSAFMVSQRVEIVTKSYQEGAEAQRWTCDGSPAYTLEPCDREDRGTDIIMHLDEDSRDFLSQDRLEGLLRKYCRFLPIPIVLGKKTEWRDGKMQETDEDNVINDTDPLWNRKPTELKDEDYLRFYRELYPAGDDPLFWIHLNVDYPFRLTGILYFPKIKNPLDLQRNRIQLYCNQVFVTDNVEGIVPEFLMLLHGVIDSPDIPLNVSRSFLQSDQSVKMISGYISKKVSDRLERLFKADRQEFEKKWDDIKLFIHYGMLSDETANANADAGSFYDRALSFFLLKDVDGKYYSVEEYRTLTKVNQTDSDGQLVLLYAQDPERQYAYIEAAKAKGYNVLLMDGQLDTPLIALLERKMEKTAFKRIDSDSPEGLISKADNAKREELAPERARMLTSLFGGLMPRSDKLDFHAEAKPLGADALPVMLAQSEHLRRMKEMSRLQAGMSFYGQMPDLYTLILNTDSPLITAVLEDCEASLHDALRPVEAKIKELSARQSVLRQEQDKKKADEISDSEREELTRCGDDLRAEERKRNDLLTEYGKANPKVGQLIDLALLQNGLLQGEALSQFVKRSVSLLLG